MSGLVGNPEDRLSNAVAQILFFSDGSCMEIKFSMMTGIVKGVSEFEIRRLATVSSGEAAAEPLATDWIWYWIDNGQKWIQYGAGTKLVSNFRKNYWPMTGFGS